MNEFDFNIDSAFGPLLYNNTRCHFIAALAAGLGGLGAGAISGAGSLIGGAGSALFGAPGLSSGQLGILGGYGGGFGATGTAGLLGAGGAAANLPLMMGLGSLGMSAFGGTATGTAPSARVKLTKRGKKLETALHTSIKGDLFPENLAARFVGAAKKMEQQRQRLSKKAFQGVTAPGPDRAVSGNVARAFLTESQARLGGVAEGPRQAGEARRTFDLNRLGQLQNFMNLQMQAPVLRAQRGLINQQLARQRGAQRGAALGGMAQLLALSRVGLT